MKIILDEREHDLYEKCSAILRSEGESIHIQLLKRVLAIGDILITTDDDKNILLIERKSFSDLFASIKDGRYDEQSYRLMHSSEFPLHNIVYLLEGIHASLKPAEKKLLYSSITSLNVFKGFSVLKTSTIQETAELVIWMANKIERDMKKGKVINGHAPKSQKNTIAVQDDDKPIEGGGDGEPELTNANYCTVVKKVKKDNITPENIGEIILCQIPGISSKTAIAIMKSFQTFPHFMEEMQKNPHSLENLKIESNGKMRKINKSCIKNIQQFLLKPPQAIPTETDTNTSSK
jgi:ERCC4-type nuclease